MEISKSINIRVLLSILLRIVGGIWAIFGVASIVRYIFASNPEPYGGSIVFAYLLRLMPFFEVYIFPGVVVYGIGMAIAKKNKNQEPAQQSNKILVIGAITAKSFILAACIFFIIFDLSFYFGGNLGPINGVILGSTASLAFFVFVLVAWILRTQGYTKSRAYSIAFAVISLFPIAFIVVAFTIKLIR
jgi:hypothetical protein